MSRPDGAPSPLEERGRRLGIIFSLGRTITSNSHLALEGAELAGERGLSWPYHRAMLKAYFEDLEDVGNVDAVVRVGASAGLDADELREALESRRYREAVDEGIAWSRSIGVTAIPTFIFAERYAMVGAQEYEAFKSVLTKIGAKPRS
jgi:predicted DsbA family dithiol-disulfide isomerase